MAFEIHREGDVVRLAGVFEMQAAAEIWQRLSAAAEVRGGEKLALDLGQVERIDGGAMALLVALRAELATKRVSSTVVNASADVAPLVDLYHANEEVRSPPRRKPESTVAQVGRVTLDVLEEIKGVLSFFGEMVLATIGLARRPRTGHWKEIPPLAEKAGADAIPIVLLINFLVGFVMAYQASKQLKMFGANIYVADLVGLSVTRELAPLMTAIIVCGRSGAAFAAEIGSMKVAEEIDALRTLGLRPFAWLVVPRVLALLIVMPILVLVGDVIGMLGGLFVGVISLDLTPQGYLSETKKALALWDVGTGLIKGGAFALAIGLIACQQGFSASGGAEGVGKRTTSTVVISLFAIVILDAVFTVLFRTFDI